MGPFTRARFEWYVNESGHERMEVHLETNKGSETIRSSFYIDVVAIETRDNSISPMSSINLPIHYGFHNDFEHGIQGLLLTSIRNNNRQFRGCGALILNLVERVDIFLKYRRCFCMNAEKVDSNSSEMTRDSANSR
jgi:hypothetical protein